MGLPAHAQGAQKFDEFLVEFNPRVAFASQQSFSVQAFWDEVGKESLDRFEEQKQSCSDGDEAKGDSPGEPSIRGEETTDEATRLHARKEGLKLDPESCVGSLRRIAEEGEQTTLARFVHIDDHLVPEVLHGIKGLGVGATETATGVGSIDGWGWI